MNLHPMGIALLTVLTSLEKAKAEVDSFMLYLQYGPNIYCNGVAPTKVVINLKVTGATR